MAMKQARNIEIATWGRVGASAASACITAILCVSCSSAPPSSQNSRNHQSAEGAASTEVGPASNAQARKPLVVQGTGQLYAPPGADVQSAAPAGMPAVGSAPLPGPGPDAAPHVATQTATAGTDGFQLNFVDTDINAVVGAVLGDGLNLPYLVDPQVKGTITLQAQRALSADEVLAALEGALRIQGVAMIKVEGVYHVVPMKEAMRRVPGLQVPGKLSHGFGVYVVPLQYVSAVEMQKTLQPFMSDAGVLRVDEGRNLLLLGGTHQEVATLLNVIATFDVDWMAGMSFGLYPLDYVDAKTLSAELEEVFADEKSPINGVVRFVPLSRLNSLMVVTPQPRYLKDVESWIKRLDQNVSTPGRRIYVYDVQNSKADDLADSLNQILSSRSSSSESRAQSSSSRSTQNSAAANNSFSMQSAPGASALGGSLQMGAGSSGFPASGSGSAGTTSTPTSSTAKSVFEGDGLRIVPSAENNSLLILASPSEFAVVEAALKRLDVLPIEVLIEASIAEVTLTKDLQYGLQWNYQSKQGPVTYSETNGSIAQQFPGLSFLYNGSANITAVLNAMETKTKVHVLSAPKLVVLNNHEAALQVGDQVPVVTQSSVSTVGQNSPIVNSVDLKDTGVILRVTPRANVSGRVLLEVTQEVSDVVPTTTSSINSPTIEQRKFSSVVAVRDGQTIALGGLITDSKTRTSTGIPLLRDIPVLGNLFGSDDHNTTRTELIVLITPHVIRSSDESEDAMEDLRSQFQGLHGLVPQWKQTESGRTQSPVKQKDGDSTKEDDEPKKP